MTSPSGPTTYRFNLFADYFQFYLQDDDIDVGDFSHSWTPEAGGLETRLALATRGVAVATERNMTVPVEVVVQPDEPADTPDEFARWDHVAEASLEVTTGRIVVAGCTDYFYSAARIPVEPGTYAVRAYYGALDTLRENDLEGDDHYKVVLWPAEPRPRRVLKAFPGRTR